MIQFFSQIAVYPQLNMNVPPEKITYKSESKTFNNHATVNEGGRGTNANFSFTYINHICKIRDVVVNRRHNTLYNKIRIAEDDVNGSDTCKISVSNVGGITNGNIYG